MYPSLLFDITGGCNAKCPLCVTARETFGQRINYISVPNFARTLDRLLELELIKPEYTGVGLQNWGEPILHPDLNGISEEIRKRGMFAGISTNASKRTNFIVSTDHWRGFVFSVPGWSQAI
jgi:MoaA/NifB/PqqE/SkfB family radical SAM enzyme